MVRVPEEAATRLGLIFEQIQNTQAKLEILQEQWRHSFEEHRIVNPRMARIHRNLGRQLDRFVGLLEQEQRRIERQARE
ncbi:MAG: hypothetical protein HY558_06545 [Euryarchaeota archaeon]|nr:hypothetical protein [Euryarchaeota archaeon]